MIARHCFAYAVTEPANDSGLSMIGIAVYRASVRAGVLSAGSPGAAVGVAGVTLPDTDPSAAQAPMVAVASVATRTEWNCSLSDSILIYP